LRQDPSRVAADRVSNEREEAALGAKVPEQSFLWRGPAGSWTVITREPSVVVLNHDLLEVARFGLPSACRGPHGVSPT
jgi:hypothetical protein